MKIILGRLYGHTNHLLSNHIRLGTVNISALHQNVLIKSYNSIGRILGFHLTVPELRFKFVESLAVLNKHRPSLNGKNGLEV